MSRCFPFPPTGYERKHKVEDLNLLKEANRKEKKHKKEKKDKDRKKDKEKEKGGGDEKHREKKERKSKHKDKKHKHRDKKYKEDRGKEKETSSISEESTVAGEVKEQSRGNIFHHPKEYIRNSCSALFPSGQPLENSLPSKTTEESKFARELDKRISDDQKSRGSQSSGGVALADEGHLEEVAGNVAAGISLPEYDAKSKRNDKKMVPKGLRHGNTLVQHINPTSKSHLERMSEDKEKYKEAADFNHQKDQGKRSHVKEKDKEKSEKVKVKDDGRNDLGDNVSIRNSSGSAVSGENVRKRKDTDTNGFLHENGRPDKMQKFAPHKLENGKKLEGFLTGAQRTSPSKQKSSAATLVSARIAEARKLPSRDSNHSNKTNKVPEMEDLIAALSRQPVHPDSKYLDKVLTVPKIGNWSEFDDQGWLFGSKRKLESAGVGEDLAVWSEAVHIESVDVCALPYVIPY